MPRITRLRASSMLAAATVAFATIAATTIGSPTATATTKCPSGPDVASWQHPSGAAIHWGKVAAACHTFAIIKATEGTGYLNPYFASDWKGVRNNGMYRGAYHYAKPALPYSTAVQQADHFTAAVGNVKENGDLPPILDLEETGGLSQASLITWTQIFLDEVQRRTGRAPAVYTYPYFWANAMANTHALARYPLWIADYVTGVTSPHTPLVGSWPDWALWQFTASASVPGIKGPTDMSRFNGTLSELADFAHGSTAGPLPIRRPYRPLRVHAGGGTTVRVSWLPNDNGGALINRYTVVASPSGAAVRVGGTSHAATFTGLHLGTTYTFTVLARNAAGKWSAESAPSNAITPQVPTSLSLNGDTSLDYGQRTTLRATLTRSDTGAALASRTVRVYVRPAGQSSWSSLASLTTSSTGQVSLSLRPKRDEAVKFRYAGNTGYRTATAIRYLAVRPVVTAWLSDTRVPNDSYVRMRGTVSPLLVGATVKRQGYYDGGWHTWDTTKVSSTGRFSFRIHVTVRTTDVYRVIVPATAGLSRGTSKRMYLKVY